MADATHAVQTCSTVVGVDEIQKAIEVFIQHPAVHAGCIYVNVCVSVCMRLFFTFVFERRATATSARIKKVSFRAIGTADQPSHFAVSQASVA